MFVDEIDIFVKGGDGGAGCISFRREKFVPRGGPDGGDGGSGGSVFLEADPALTTLLDYHYQRHYQAERGQHGEGNNRSGASGEDLVLRVPVGTARADADRSIIIADLPALIADAAEGKGLGHQFLRHTERTRLLVHLLDPDPNTGRDLVEDLDTINAELAAYSPELAARPQIVAVNKADLLDGAPQRRAEIDRLRTRCAEVGWPFLLVSAATGQGLRELVGAIAARLDATGWLRAAS